MTPGSSKAINQVMQFALNMVSLYTLQCNYLQICEFKFPKFKFPEFKYHKFIFHKFKYHKFKFHKFKFHKLKKQGIRLKCIRCPIAYLWSRSSRKVKKSKKGQEVPGKSNGHQNSQDCLQYVKMVRTTELLLLSLAQA